MCIQACVQHIVLFFTVFEQYVVVFVMQEAPVVFGEFFVEAPLVAGLKPS